MKFFFGYSLCFVLFLFTATFPAYATNPGESCPSSPQKGPYLISCEHKGQAGCSCLCTYAAHSATQGIITNVQCPQRIDPTSSPSQLNTIGSSKKACGESCTTDNDCRNPSTAGVPTLCRKAPGATTGICEQANCPAGQTQPGSACTCSTKKLCGQQCDLSSDIKECEDGSECGFITTANTCVAGESVKTYCIPSHDMVKNGYVLQQCTDTTGATLTRTKSSQAILSERDVLIACGRASPTPTPFPPPPPVCIGVTQTPQVTTPGDVKSNNSGPYRFGDQIAFEVKRPPVIISGQYDYQGKCDIVQKGRTIENFQLHSIGPGSPRFSPIRVTQVDAEYQCSFRICVTTGEQMSCSPWGALPPGSTVQKT